MRVLADENIWPGAVNALRTRGDDVAWVLQDAPGAIDEEVLARAGREQRLLVTADKGFGDLVFVRLLPADHGVILIRTEGPLDVRTARLLETINMREDWSRLFASVGDTSVRIRPVPSHSA